MKSITSSDAYIQYDEETGAWAFGTGRLQGAIAAGQRGLVHLGLKDGAGHALAPAAGSGLFSLHLDLGRYDASLFDVQSWSMSEEGGALLLEFDLTCPSLALNVRFTIRIFPGAPGWQQRLMVTAGAEGLRLHGLAPVDYRFQMDSMHEIAYTMKGCKHQGGFYKDLANIPYEDFRMDAAELGRVFVKSGRRTTEDYLPCIFLNSSHDQTGLFAGVQWSGHWFIDACNGNDASDPKKLINIAAGPDEFLHTLQPGQAFPSPWCYLGLYEGDIDEAAKAHRQFLDRAVLPPKPYASLPVAYNAWFLMEHRISEDKLRAAADVAAALGVECFVIDAGWYGGSRPEFSCRESFSTGLGDWHEDRSKFPSGIGDFADYVRTKGMKFGLWVEPERVDLTTYEVGGWKREWLTCDETGKPYELAWDAHHSGWLCFGIPAVRQWAKGWLSELIERYRLDWLKWDSNWWTICKCEGHGHQAQDGEYRHVQGVYEVFEYLLKKYPNLTIENCAGGGTRMDTGILQYAHVNWLDDESELGRRVRCHCSRVSRYLPLNSAYTFALPDLGSLAEYPEHVGGDAEGFRRRLDFELRSRMMGVWALGYDLSKLPGTARETIADNIALYKRIRDIVGDGDFYNLMPITRFVRPGLAVGENEAYLSVLPDQSRAVLFVFINIPDDVRPIRLKGLSTGKTYRVRELPGGHAADLPGSALMSEGFAPASDGKTRSMIYLLE